MHRLLSPTRLKAIEQLELARPSRDALEALTLSAMRSLNCPRSQVSLVTADRQYTLAITGVDKDGRAYTGQVESQIEGSICSWIVDLDQALAIEDAQDFPLVCNASCVTTDGIRAYLGHPISSYEGEPLGAFCVIDYEPRDWLNKDKIMLASYANSVNLILLQAMLALEDIA